MERTRPQDLLSPDGSAAAAVARTQVDDAATTNRSSGLGGGDSAPSKVNPVAFPTSDSAPIAFPTSTSDETASQKAPSMTQTLGITSVQGVSTPERTGTPDPEFETKRKRISVTRRPAGSVSGIPILGNLRRMRRLALALRQRRSQWTATPGPKRLRNLQHRPLATQTKIRPKRRKRRGGSSDRGTGTPYFPRIIHPSCFHSVPF